MSANELTIAQLSRALYSRELSAVEAASYCLDVVRARAGLNNFITVCEERALSSAREADLRIARGERTPLLGIPVAIKDNIMTAGVRTTCASRCFGDFVPNEDADVVRSLDAAGAVVIGKTNMDEFAMGSANEYSAFGCVKNPLDPARVPGGSSGGSAGCVAAGQAFGALGTDTGGSVRQPAAYCGVVGLKPTAGSISYRGTVGFSHSLDEVGVFARDCAGAAAMFSGVGGGELAPLVGNARVLTVGVADSFYSEKADPDVIAAFDSAVSALRSAGATVKKVRIPSFDAALAAYHVISSADAAHTVEKNGILGKKLCECIGLGDEILRRILTGYFVLSGVRYEELYVRAEKVRKVMTAEYTAALSDCDVLLSPTAPTVAPRIGEKLPPHVKHNGDMFTSPVSLAGLPAVSVPFGSAHGMPVGVQIIGRRGGERDILNAGTCLEEIVK